MGFHALRVQLFTSAPGGGNWMALKDGCEEEADAPAKDGSNQAPAQEVERSSHEETAVEEEDG